MKYACYPVHPTDGVGKTCKTINEDFSTWPSHCFCSSTNFSASSLDTTSIVLAFWRKLTP